MKTTQSNRSIKTLAQKGIALTVTTALSLVAAVTLGSTPAQASTCVDLGFVKINCDGRGGSNPAPEVEKQYYVTVKNPHTGSVERRVGPYRESEANQQYNALQNTHYAVYRYLGIGEQIKTKSFSSQYSAQQYLDSNGPCRDANIFGICALDLKQIRPAIVAKTLAN